MFLPELSGSTVPETDIEGEEIAFVKKNDFPSGAGPEAEDGSRNRGFSPPLFSSSFSFSRRLFVCLLITCFSIVSIILISSRYILKKPHVGVVFVIRTLPANYHTRLQEQVDSWLKNVPGAQIVISSAEGSNVPLPANLPESASVVLTDCPDGHALGPGCTEASAYLFLLKNYPYDFDWAFVIDDDVLVFPHGLEKVLSCGKELNAYGIPGCAAKGFGGFCGGGGYAISKRGLGMIVDWWGGENEFFEKYMALVGELEYCDIVTSWALRQVGVELTKLEGINSWKKTTEDIQSDIANGTPILSLHYTVGSMIANRDLVEQDPHMSLPICA